LLEYQGETLLDRHLALYSGFCQPLICVLGSDAGVVGAGLRLQDEAVFVLNPRPERGQLSSLQCGLRALLPRGPQAPPPCEAVFFLPCDSVAVESSTLQAMIEAWRAAARRSAFVIPRHAGRRGHPVLMSGAMIPQMLALPAGAAARDLVRSHAEDTCYVDVDDARVHLDIDTPGDYDALLKGVRL
jgi:CTP:molybdopterin cytidylyltransferase MocA